MWYSKKYNTGRYLYTLGERELHFIPIIFYYLKARICEKLGRVRDMYTKDKYGDYIDTIVYHMGNVYEDQEGNKHWQEKLVEIGIFKNWYVCHYNNGY